MAQPNYMTVNQMEVNYADPRFKADPRSKREWTDADFQESRRRYARYLSDEISFNEKYGSKMTPQEVAYFADERLRKDGLPTSVEVQQREDLSSIDMNMVERIATRAERAQRATLDAIRRPAFGKSQYMRGLDAAADEAARRSTGWYEGVVGEGVGLLADPVWLATYGVGRLAQAGKLAKMAPWRAEIVKDAVAGAGADFVTGMAQTGGDVGESLSRTGQGVAFAVGGGIALRGIAKALRIDSANITPERIMADARKQVLRDPEALSEINRLRGEGVAPRDAEARVLAGVEDQLARALDPEQGVVRGLLDAKRQGSQTYDQYVDDLLKANDAENRSLMAEIDRSIYDVEYQKAGTRVADDLENRRILQSELNARKGDAAADEAMRDVAESRAREIVPDEAIQESKAIRQAEQDAALGDMGVAMYGVRKAAGEQADLLNKANDIDAEVPSTQVDKFNRRAEKTAALRGEGQAVQELPNARPEVEADVVMRRVEEDAIREDMISEYRGDERFEDEVEQLVATGQFTRTEAEDLALGLDFPEPQVSAAGKSAVGESAVPDMGAPKEPWQMSKSEFIRDTETTPKSNKTDSPSPNKYKDGDFVIDGYGDDPYVYQLQRVSPEELSFSLEGEELSRVVDMPTTQQYIEWYKQGIDPPPVDVVIKDSGARHSTNRRRVVAAREAGVKDIPAFVEIGRHKSMVKQALAEGKPVPPEVLKDYPDLAPTRPVEGASGEQATGDLFDEAFSAGRSAARKDLVEKGVVEIRREDGSLEAILTKSSKPGAKLQKTYLDQDGRPTSDELFDDIDSALDSMSDAFLARRPDIPDDLPFVGYDSPRTYIYESTQRPVGPGAVPREGMTGTRPGGKYGQVTYDRVLSEAELSQYSLKPIGFEDAAPTTGASGDQLQMFRSGIAPDDIAAMVSDAIAAGKWTAKQSILATRWAMSAAGDAIRTMRDFAGVMIDKFGRGIRKHIPEMWQRFKDVQARRAKYAQRRQRGAIDLRSNKVPKTAQQQIASKARAEAKAVAREQRVDREANRAMADMGVKERLPMSERGKFLTRVRKAHTPKRVNKTLIQADRARVKLEKDLAIEKSRKELLKQIKGRKDSPIRIAAQNSEFADDFNRIHALGVKDPRKGPTLGELRRMDDGQRADVVRAYADIEAKFLKSRADVHVGEEVTEAARGIAKEVNSLGRKEMKVTDGATGERNASLLKQVGREESLQPERLVERLGKRAMAAIYNPIAESKGNYYKTVKSFNEELTARLKQAGIADPESGKWLNSVSGPRANKRTVKLDGQDVTFTDGQFWSLLANLTDPQTRKLVEGGAPITLANDTTRRFKIDEDGLRTILASSTEQDRAVVKAIKEVYNGTSKDRLNKTWRELFGKDLATHDDYFPRMRDVEKTIDDIEEVMRPAQDGTLEGRSLAKERTENPDAPVVIGDILSTSDKHFAQVSAIVEMAPAVRKVRAILGNREFKDATVRSYGDSMHRAIDTWVQDVIEEAGGFRRPMTPTQVTLGKLVSNTAVGVLGVNPWVILKQLPSFGNAMTEIDPRFMLQGAKDAIMLEPRAVRDRMFEHSPQIWARYKVHASRLIGDMRNSTPIQRASSDLSDKLMAGISWADQNVIASIWRASELKVKAEQPNLKGDAYWKAVNDQADKVIRRTQPNFDSVNTSSIQRKGKGDPFMKAASMFMSQRNTNYNMLYSALASKDPKRIAAILGVVAVAQPLMISGVDETRDWMYGRQEHESGGDLALSLATDVVANNFSQVYFAGPILDPATRGVSNAISGKSNYIFPPSNPITSTANGIQEGIAKLLDGTIDGDGERAWDGFERAMLSAAALGGVPIRSPYRFAEELIERYNEADQED